MGLSQLYIKRDESGNIILIAAKLTDDILLFVPIPELVAFSNLISGRYKVRKTIIDYEIQFNGSEISQDHHDQIFMDMTNFLSKINPIHIDKTRRKQDN